MAAFNCTWTDCLGCMACMTACPSGVEYNKLIEPVRAQIERNIPRSLSERFFRKLIFATFPHPKRLRVLALPLLVYQKSGLRTLVRASGIPKLLPKQMAAMEALLPDVPSHPFAKLPPSIKPTRCSAAARGHAEWLRAAGLLLARERGDCAGAGGGRLRGCDSA